MPRGSGSPRFAQVQAQSYIDPTELNYNVRSYAIGVGSPTKSNAVMVQGFGMWSVYILVTGLGNVSLELIVMDETDANELTYLTLSTTVTAGAWRHYTFGPPGATVNVVPWRMVKLNVYGATNTGNVTARMFGRAI